MAESDNNITIKPQKMFKEQLEEFGPEFAIAMEKYRETHFGDMFRFLVHSFKLEKELKSMNNNEQEEFINMCKMMHNFGFYGGVSFTLDPDVEYEPHVQFQDQ